MKHLATLFASLALLLTLTPACAPGGDDPLDGADAPFPGGKADGGIDASSPEARAVLSLVNDPLVGFAELDDDAGLNKRAAENIIDHRNGADGTVGTADDDAFDDLDELDAVKYVGPYALQQLLAYAIDKGYLGAAASVNVIFSPQPYDNSHSARVAQLIDGAQQSVDIAMYSYSDARIAGALQRAVDRGVKIRFLFDTASEDRKLSGSALENSASGRLERIGINVRWVNKIMHHKFMIVDGPRDDVSNIDTATVVAGSGNWSNGAATRYDENTLFFTGYRELTMRMQKEFNRMWAHSRDVVIDASLPYELSTLAMDAVGIPDEASTHAWFTSSNFSVNGDTFRINGNDTVSTALANAIRNADTSIHIASGHLRSRPISEALMEVAKTKPWVNIKVLLDGQEYISDYTHQLQQQELDDCLAAATTASQTRHCLDSGFYFSYEVSELKGIPLRFKYYAYRWDYHYAVQMHHKYIIIDGDELHTGSYNFSDNAEHNTFDDTLTFAGPEFAGLVGSYEANFAQIWDQGRAEGLYNQLMAKLPTANPVPIVFDPMALTWSEVTDLKRAIRDACPDVNAEDYRTNPQNHWVCYK